MAAQSETAPESHHHVHFDTKSLRDDNFESDNFVIYQRVDDGITVNLGFLQVNHKYAIDLKLPSTYFLEFTKLDNDSNSFVPDVSSDVPNLNCHVVDFSGKPTTPDGCYEMKIDFFAYKEKLMKETIKIVNSKNSKEILKLIIVARVLGKGKGTPMLRNGIHCTGVVKDDESEASDFGK